MDGRQLTKYNPAAFPYDPSAAIAAANTAYDITKYFARGASGARKRARKRRRRRRDGGLSSAPPMPRASTRQNPLAVSAMAAPVAMGQRVKQDYSGLSKYTVRHAEYIADIAGSVGFSVGKFRVNAADPVTYPWLSLIAPNFEKYHFKSLKFMLKPQAPSIIPGVIMMAFDYDPSDEQPFSKADMLQYDGAVRVNSWSSQEMTMKKTGALYTASMAPTASADLRLTDAANLFVATSGQSDTSLISELWVEYEVDLLIPQARQDCDTFVLAKDNWTPDQSFTSANVTNPSTNFDIDPLDSTRIKCLKRGTFGISCYAIGFILDLSLDTPYSVIVNVNGVPIGNLTGLGFNPYPVQIRCLHVSAPNGLVIDSGDVITFDPSDPGLATDLRLAIYATK